MLEFDTPFAGLVSQRKLTDAELIRAIRYAIADPEHSRGYIEEEPCDDDRAGRYEEGRINESPKRPR